jgi:hypothetical protein
LILFLIPRTIKVVKKILLIFLLLDLVLLSGCYALKKKFIRKKESKEPVVYVDFKEYQGPHTQEAYQDYYIFAQGWLDELVKAIAYTENRKKQKQAIKEALFNMEQLFYFFNQQGQERLSPLYEQLMSIKTKIYSAQLHEVERYYALKKIESLKRQFQREFKWENASQWME